MQRSISDIIAQELNVKSNQVNAAIQLLDEGATVPFIARYRKEVTQGLDDTQLRHLEERMYYLRELEERRQTILASIKEQEKLTPELERSIIAAETKNQLEDLYLPYKPKRRTKAQIAKEAGIEPLALILLENPELNPDAEAEKYLNKDAGFADVKAVLDGARQILMEKFAEEATLLGALREYLWEHGVIVSKVAAGKEQEGAKFSDYFDYKEAIKKIPSHRALALFRGRKEQILLVQLILDESVEKDQFNTCEALIAKHFQVANKEREADKWLCETVRWAWRIKIATHLEIELMSELKENAEAEAIQVFAKNVKDLLLAAPAGHKATIGLDPGLRTGVKVAVIDTTGKLVDTVTIYPIVPHNKEEESLAILVHLAKKHNVELISIGNGTGSRETDKFVAKLMKQNPELNLKKVMVSEAGASVYSASELAAKEFPELDVSLRGAVSIARRLQDPLAELVKIDPKSIGVGQYQHDVNQVKLSRSLDAVVEDCVNAVGVDVNTASVELLTSVSGLNKTLAQNIVAFRDKNGAFKTRDAIKQVPRMGEKAFEQAAGFLRIQNGDNPLDASSVHPEAYPVVEKILQTNSAKIQDVIGNNAFLRKLDPVKFTDETFGLPTVTDIIKELEKPGRDPRPEFVTAAFQDGVESIADLKTDMILEGVVTNVTNFGAFIDIGVHQDGLAHISELADKFVSDPKAVLKAGDVVKVKVLEVDKARKRISLTLRLTQQARDHVADKKPGIQRQEPQKQVKKAAVKEMPMNNALGSALANAFKRAEK